jgi:ferredoxin
MEYVRCAFNEPCELCLVVCFYMNLVLVLYASEYLISVPIFFFTFMLFCLSVYPHRGMLALLIRETSKLAYKLCISCGVMYQCLTACRTQLRTQMAWFTLDLE